MAIDIVGTATGFISGIFKKPATKDGFGRFIKIFTAPTLSAGWKHKVNTRPWIIKFMKSQPMTASEKTKCTNDVLSWCRNWTKAQRKNLQNACANIRVIPEPKPKPPVEAHKVSASYKPEAITKTTTKSRDIREVTQAGLFKIPANLKTPLFILVGGIAILSIFKLVKGSAR